MKRALQVIFGLSLFGSLFSGILSYQELFGSSALACPAPGAAGTLFGYPACIYGFAMFAVITITAAVGLQARSDADAEPAARRPDVRV